MQSKIVRQKYLDFFAARGHAIVPSAPIVPENDPTTLFTSSGMQPLVPYLTGTPHPLGKRLTNSQKCFRAEDIEDVGDNRHTTFFEMLGNWSLGDYFKAEQIPWFYEFLTGELGLPPERLWVSCFAGDTVLGIPRDEESASIWSELGIPEERIRFYDTKKNWWSRSGPPEKMPVGEIGGADSEVFYEFTNVEHDRAFGEHCHPNCDCGRFIEIGNSVFIQYRKADKTRSDLVSTEKVGPCFEELPQRNVDFGGGLERLTAATGDKADIFETDLFLPMITAIEEGSGKRYTEHARSMRLIADHLRGAVFMAAAGIIPGNTEQGYIMRRLLRRAVRHADTLELPEGSLHRLVLPVIMPFEGVYEDVVEQKTSIAKFIEEEEAKFRITLARGLKHFHALSGDTISGENAFVLFTTYGFPVEVTQELAAEQGKRVDMPAYEQAMEAHQALSRAGAEQKFKGGLADHSEQTVRYHTTHHILLKALQMVLGPNVHQRGSNITAERLRIDFSFDRKMTDEEKQKVEEIVNEQIKAHLPVTRTVMPREEAERLGAEHEFNADYPEMVSLYSIGPKDATPDDQKFSEAFSIEYCGGPHVENTKEIAKGGVFKIKKEEASSAGIRRIKATIELSSSA